MRAIARDGRVIHARIDGPAETAGGVTAPVVAFSNSLGTDLRVWDAVIERLPAEWIKIRYDIAGHGLSGITGSTTVSTHAEDFAAVLDAFEADRAAVVGLSVGGLIGLALAIARPERVTTLCLMDTAPKIGSAEMWAARMTAIETGGLESIADSVMERWFSAAFRTRRPAELALWRAMMARTPARGYLDLCATLRDTDLTEAASGLAVPTLCLCGSEDGATPPDLVRACASIIPGARYEEIAGAGHLPCIEAPDTVANLIISFIKEHSA